MDGRGIWKEKGKRKGAEGEGAEREDGKEEGEVDGQTDRQREGDRRREEGGEGVSKREKALDGKKMR